MQQGLALVISAPSGTGKSTLAKMLLEEFPNLKFSVSCTTRPMRKNEENGKDYFFISQNEFEKMREDGRFAEWAEVHGSLYGTPLDIVQNTLLKGGDLLFDIDVQGAAQIKASIPSAQLVFILPPSLNTLENRLKTRQQDDESVIRKRMLKACEEIAFAPFFDAVLVNDNLEKAYEQLRSLYIAFSLKPSNSSGLLQKLLKEKI